VRLFGLGNSHKTSYESGLRLTPLEVSS
jgi:hypothetical protein